jgi:hypothetical protein
MRQILVGCATGAIGEFTDACERKPAVGAPTFACIHRLHV